MTKNIGHYSKNSRTCHLLCERPGCYHNTSKTDVRDMIIKLSAIHSSSDLSDSLNLLNSVKVLLNLGKTPMNQIKANQNKTKWECNYGKPKYFASNTKYFASNTKYFASIEFSTINIFTEFGEFVQSNINEGSFRDGWYHTWLDSIMVGTLAFNGRGPTIFLW